MKAIPVDVYDSEGNMTKIEAQDANGEHIADFLWDPQDEQTSQKRIEFRAFTYRFLEQKGYEVDR